MGPTANSDTKINIQTSRSNGATKPDPPADSFGRFIIIIHSPSSKLVAEYVIKFRASEMMGKKATAISTSYGSYKTVSSFFNFPFFTYFILTFDSNTLTMPSLSSLDPMIFDVKFTSSYVKLNFSVKNSRILNATPSPMSEPSSPRVT